MTEPSLQPLLWAFFHVLDPLSSKSLRKRRNKLAALIQPQSKSPMRSQLDLTRKQAFLLHWNQRTVCPTREFMMPHKPI